MMLFLIFFPRHSADIDNSPESEDPTWKEAIVVLAVSIAFFVFSLLGSVIVTYGLPTHLRGWANFLGVLGTILAAIQYIPQIVTTWKLQQVGSLSVPMMCIQTPGSFVFAASLAARLGPGGWSAWGLFILTGLLQAFLLAMSIWFLYRDSKAKMPSGAADQSSNNMLANGHGQDGTSDTSLRSSERTPLLRDEAR